MYLSELKLWNFRKYGITGNSKEFEKSEPGLVVNFNDGVNVLVGENDSGKTAIVDAIRYVLKTQSLEFISIEDKDFHKEKGGERATELKIECTFSGFNADGKDAGHFLEWIGFNEENEFELKVRLYAKRKDDNSIYQSVKAGIDADGSFIEGEARDLLRVIYLKPLRDALSEMTQGNKSRLAQILKSLEKFKKEKDSTTGKKKKHQLEEKYDKAKKEIDGYFNNEDGDGKVIVDIINEFLNEEFFIGTNEERKKRNAIISLAENELSEILRQLNLILEDNKSGLGSLNLLYIAAELLHLKERKTGLKLTLIEELEAHLHPQYQLRLIDFIQKESKDYGQFILTTHSTTLASSIELENLIICKEDKVFPMGQKHTQLEEGDYRFLERFLDATKANLFFAKGVIIVEGDAENLLIPTIAKLIGKPLHEYGVSIVNVGSTAFNRYRKIFLRKDLDDDSNKDQWLDIKVAVITDLDVPSMEYWEDKGTNSVYLILRKDIRDLENITEDVEWDNMTNIPIQSVNEFQKLYKCNKKVKTKNLKEGVNAQLESKFLEFEKEIDVELIKKQRIRKHYKSKNEINCQNVQGFLPQAWTLEYDLALSRLFKELEISKRLAKYLDSNSSVYLTDEIIQEIRREVIEEPLSQNTKTAYEIFKPLNEGKISKATTAQCLALILEQTKGIKEILLDDPNLAYLREAIYYVTEPNTSYGGQENEE
jgi:putative ATP-dependent endonuclease of OLD family